MSWPDVGCFWCRSSGNCAFFFPFWRRHVHFQFGIILFCNSFVCVCVCVVHCICLYMWININKHVFTQNLVCWFLFRSFLLVVAAKLLWMNAGEMRIRNYLWPFLMCVCVWPKSLFAPGTRFALLDSHINVTKMILNWVTATVCRSRFRPHFHEKWVDLWFRMNINVIFTFLSASVTLFTCQCQALYAFFVVVFIIMLLHICKSEFNMNLWD